MKPAGKRAKGPGKGPSKGPGKRAPSVEVPKPRPRHEPTRAPFCPVGQGPVDFILTSADERLVRMTPPGVARLAMAFGRLAMVL